MAKLWLVRSKDVKSYELNFVDEHDVVQEYSKAEDIFINRVIRHLVIWHAVDNDILIQERIFAFKILLDKNIYDIVYNDMFPDAFESEFKLTDFQFYEAIATIAHSWVLQTLNKELGFND